ncbi:MAG: thiamine pyrophosphate-binding protein [Pseudomonadota bacterium]
MTRVADTIAQRLAEAGCRHAFGIPGGEVLAMMQALDAAGLKFTLCRHENAGGFMAEGAWHATDAPGVLLATIGPGVVNAVNVIANALQDRVPLIVLTGCVDALEAETYTHQVFDHQAVLRPLVKASFKAAPDTAGIIADKAIAIALDGQPGPVHIDIPIGAAEAEMTGPVPRRTRPAPVAPPPGPDFDRAVSLIRAAQRPLVIAGVDAVTEHAGDAVAVFCRHLSAPLITTYKAKGLIDERDPLSLGGHGLSPKSDVILKPLLAETDLIMLAGYDPIEMRPGWRDPWPEGTEVIEIAAVPNTHYMHQATLAFTAAVGPTLDLLRGATDAKTGWPDNRPAEIRQALADAFTAPSSWGPHQVFDTLRQNLPQDTVITADSGAHRILLSQMWPCYTPRSLLQSSALCTMGCAVPLAAGHAIAAPDTPICAFIGDAGLEMTLGELATLREERLPVLVVVLVDDSLALIELKQRNAQRPNLGVDFTGSDLPAVARALGGHGAWIDDTETLRAEAIAAFDRDTFTLLACRIGRRAYDGTF